MALLLMSLSCKSLKMALSNKQKVLIYIVIIISCIGIGIFFNFSKIQGYATDLSISTAKLADIRIHKIYISGNHALSKKDIANIAHLYKGRFMVYVSPHKIRKSLEQQPWIKHVCVIEKLPHTIYIDVMEYKPFVLLAYKKEYFLVDEEGCIFTKAHDISNLIVISGRNAVYNLSLVRKILYSKNAKLVKAMQYIGERRWNIVLKSGITVKLPEENPYIAWQYLLQSKLLYSNAKEIDLRLSDKIFLAR